MSAAMRVKRWPSSSSERVSTPRMTACSSDSAVETSGTAPAFSYSTPLWTSSVTSPPSSRIMFGPLPSGQRTVCSRHHQYSSSVSPFHAKTGTPDSAIAAAAWSWVEKMLQLAQRTSAPSAVSVSMSTAVWMVMCSEPVMRAPLRGCRAANSSRIDIRPGISCSASLISLRPKSASERTATLKSPVVVGAVSSVVMRPPSGSREVLSASPAPSSASRRPGRRRDARALPRTTPPPRPATPGRGAGVARSRPRRGRCPSARAARAGCAAAGAPQAHRGGSRSPSGAARPARAARRSAACGPTSRSSRPPRGWGARPRDTTLPTLCQGLAGGVENALARLVAGFVEPDDRAHAVVGGAQALDDVAGLHLVVALPRRLDVDLGARRGGALGLHRRLSGALALGLAQAPGLAAGRPVRRLRRGAAGGAQALGAVVVGRLALGRHRTAVGLAGALGLALRSRGRRGPRGCGRPGPGEVHPRDALGQRLDELAQAGEGALLVGADRAGERRGGGGGGCLGEPLERLVGHRLARLGGDLVLDVAQHDV